LAPLDVVPFTKLANHAEVDDAASSVELQKYAPVEGNAVESIVGLPARGSKRLWSSLMVGNRHPEPESDSVEQYVFAALCAIVVDA
jgi:hypothetical protein